MTKRLPIVDDLEELLGILPPEWAARIWQETDTDKLVEVVMDLGRRPEVRFSGHNFFLSNDPVTREDLAAMVSKVGEFGDDNRAGIEGTLHRISAIRNRRGDVVGLTCRVGRSVMGAAEIIRDAIESGRSTLMMGPPGSGKSTILREAARILADDLGKRVVVIDTSNEIAGDGDIPHAAIGMARRMQVPRSAAQHAVMIEAVENHMPEVIIIDEISTVEEAEAARTIAERGVQLIGTAHGNSIDNLMMNPSLNDLVGGIHAVTLSDEEARRRNTQKTVQERKGPPTFDVAIEIQTRHQVAIHWDVAEVVDDMLQGKEPRPQVRTVDEHGAVKIHKQVKQDNEPDSTWQMENGKRLKLYPYSVSRSHLERVLTALRLEAEVTKNIEEADVVLVLKQMVNYGSRVLEIAQQRQLPVFTVKSNQIPQIQKAVQAAFGIERRRGA